MNLTADQIVERLNSMVEADPEAIMDLISSRVPCNDKLADHSTCQVEDHSEQCCLTNCSCNGKTVVGMLGILNGILGNDSNGLGYLCAELDNGKLIRFKKTPQYKD